MSSRIDGYVIVARSPFPIDYHYRSFGRTPAEAWRNYIDPWRKLDPGDLAIATTRHMELGCRVRKASMEIDDGHNDGSRKALGA